MVLKPGLSGGFPAVAVFQLVHPLEAKAESAFAAVDFKTIVVFVARRQPRGFQSAVRARRDAFAGREFRQKSRGIVHGDFLHVFAFGGCRPAGLFTARAFLDESFLHPDHFGNVANEITRNVNHVRVQVAERAGAGPLLAHPPVHRKIRVRQPILQIGAAEMANLPELSRFDNLFRVGNRRHTAIVENDHVLDARFADRFEHLLRFGQRRRQRLFAEHMLAGLGGGNGDFGMHVVGCVNVNDVNERRLDHLAPVRGRELPAELRPGGFHAGAIPAANGVHLDFGFEWEKVRRLTPGVGVSLSHEAVTDHPDAQCPGHKQR